MNVALVGIHLAALCAHGAFLHVRSSGGHTGGPPPPAHSHTGVSIHHASTLSYMYNSNSREGLLAAKLNELERHFEPEGSQANTTGDGNGPAEHMGADRMNPRQHNYGPAYAKYLSELGDDFMRGVSVPQSPGRSDAQSTNVEHPEDGRIGKPQKFQSRNHPVYAKYLTKLASTESTIASLERLAPTIVEVGILTGSGLAMWNSLFPKSRIYGFDIDTGPYLAHAASYKKLGFNDTSTQVQFMDERADNSRKFAETLGTAKANIVVDDGDHSPESTRLVFDSISKSLADKFVYFVEDVQLSDLGGYLEGLQQNGSLQACVSCEVEIIPSMGNDKEARCPQGMIVISRL